MRFPAAVLSGLWALWVAQSSPAQTVHLPVRATNDLAGGEFLKSIESLPLPVRETNVYQQIISGHFPSFLRTFCPVPITNLVAGRTNVGTIFVAPDYLAIGQDDDYALMPMTPQTAQRIADAFDCILPTPRMVDAIYAAAEVKLEPLPIPPSAAMTTPAVFAQHNGMVHTQRLAELTARPLGALVAGDKKDVVISTRLATGTNQVAIYGWHRPDGKPIQPLYTGHAATWVDYSHGIRLVHQEMDVNGRPMNITNVLADPKLAGLLSDEGVITQARYTTELASEREQRFAAWPDEFSPGTHRGELIRELHLPNEVRAVINTPTTTPLHTNQPVLLVCFTTPNGNTIEQTMGKKLKAGDDWHFDIQHIAAQTRFLRQVLTNQTVVVAYLENSLKSWPAWRRKNGDEMIPRMVTTIKAMFTNSPVELALTGHSGGGSWIFGYLNSVADIPPDVQRIAFLDSNYAYETERHADKLKRWLKQSPRHYLCVIAYHDSIALLNGKTFVSEKGGTWGRSHIMLQDLESAFTFASRTNGPLRTTTALDDRIQFLLMENPERKILHTVQVERNGFIHAMLMGTPFDSKGYEYYGIRAYGNWITGE